jgi:hypothetical protein
MAFRTAARSVPLSLPSPISTNRLSHNLTWFRDRGREGERNAYEGASAIRLRRRHSANARPVTASTQMPKSTAEA